MEWTVVTVIIALVGLIAVVAKPMMSLSSAMTRLSTLLDGLGDDIKELSTDNSKSHDRIWKHNDEQDRRLDDHEHRLTVMEERK